MSRIESLFQGFKNLIMDKTNIGGPYIVAACEHRAYHGEFPEALIRLPEGTVINRYRRIFPNTPVCCTGVCISDKCRHICQLSNNCHITHHFPYSLPHFKPDKPLIKSGPFGLGVKECNEPPFINKAEEVL